jgi:hypothetical protein
MTDRHDIPPHPTTNYCFVCGGDHSFKECPSIQPPAPPTPPSMDPQEERPSSSLAPTQFEEIFGEGAEGLLEDVLDRPDVFNKEQQDLALAILGGNKSLHSASGEDRTHIDDIAQQLAFLSPPAPKTTVDVRPAYVHYQAEMEDFEEPTSPWPMIPK